MRVSQLKSAFFLVAFVTVCSVLSFVLVRDSPPVMTGPAPGTAQPGTALFLLTGIVAIVAFGAPSPRTKWDHGPIELLQVQSQNEAVNSYYSVPLRRQIL